MTAIGSGLPWPRKAASPAFLRRKAGKYRCPMTRRSIGSDIGSRTCSPTLRRLFQQAALAGTFKPAPHKAQLRARAVRSIDALWREIELICDLFGPAACQNYLAAAGNGFT